MKLLLDTQLLLWAAGQPARLKPPVRGIALLTTDAVVARYPGPVRKV